MPGKKEGATSYTYMTAAKLHREVSAAESVSQAAIAGVPEAIPLHVDEDDPQREGVSIGRENSLIIGVLLPAAVTDVTVQVFVDMAGNTGAANSWALVHEEAGIDFSTHISLQDVYPANCKVLVTAMTGSGTVQIVYSKSA